MVRLIIIKKNVVPSYTISFLILSVVILSTYFFLTNNNSIETFTPIISKNHTDFDLDGNGENDKIEMSKENNSCILDIRGKDKTYSPVNKDGSNLSGNSSIK